MSCSLLPQCDRDLHTAVVYKVRAITAVVSTVEALANGAKKLPAGRGGASVRIHLFM
jgi:hypothetical protein